MLAPSKRAGWRFMAISKTSSSMRFIAHDLRRDWRGWSRSERITATLVGVGVLTLALIVATPNATALPW
jgi:hypothetical protein